MFETLLLNLLIGLLLCISLGIFYESTVIFYVMLHIHIIFMASLIGTLFNFKETIGELIANPLSLVGYIIPLTVEILLGIISINIKYILNRFVSFQDVVLITTTPLIVVSMPFVFTNLQQFISSAARFNIYESFNILGLLSNTLILFVGGMLGLYMVSQFYH